MLPFSSMGPKNTTSDSQKQPILRTWDCVQGVRKRGGGGDSAHCHSVISSSNLLLPTACKNLPFMPPSRPLPTACAFLLSFFRTKCSFYTKMRKKKKTAHTDHSLKTEEGNRQKPSSLQKRLEEKKKYLHGCLTIKKCPFPSLTNNSRD